MARILAPNESYTGVSASVAFCNGEGKTDNPILIDWFKNHGYKVEEEVQKEYDPQEGEPLKEDNPQFKEMTVDELRFYAEEKGIDLGNATSKDGMLKKIRNVESAE
ncbi:hypothetical protein [Clostridium cadaveris]|uniref:hypothetical protein n=1 Tax=Clostridium cadaveris TaxID=1529 RepID=UPI0015B3C301|nr:hypothetical protein [Clostridium cadaveris]NWK12788.1 hypothetical protein [Clostridium cadaveris]